MTLSTLTAVHTVELQKLTTAPGQTLGAEATWTAVATARCRIQPVSDRERSEFAKRGFHVTHRLYFSRDPGLDERHRVVFAGRVFEDLRVRDTDELGRLWVVTATEKTQRR